MVKIKLKSSLNQEYKQRSELERDRGAGPAVERVTGRLVPAVLNPEGGGDTGLQTWNHTHGQTSPLNKAAAAEVTEEEQEEPEEE